MEQLHLMPFVIHTSVAKLRLWVVVSFPVRSVDPGDRLKGLRVESKLDASGGLAKVCVQRIRLDLNGEVKPFACIGEFLGEEMAAAHVVDATKMAGVNFDTTDIVIKRYVVNICATRRTTLNDSSFAKPEISVFEYITLVCL